MSQIYNVDEAGMPLDHRPPKIVMKKGQKKVCRRTSGPLLLVLDGHSTH